MRREEPEAVRACSSSGCAQHRSISRSGVLTVVHESAPAYVLDPPSRPNRHDVNRVLRDAAERGARLAARGRHASAIRLLSRASRVLEAREELALAASCAESLAWILRGRGQSDLALEQFERVETLLRRPQGDRNPQRPAGDVTALQAVIGRGVVWTDQYRFHQAEAALRAAVVSANVLESPLLADRACLALSRCLYWQGRHDEAATLLRATFADRQPDEAAVEAWALMSRVQAAGGDLRAALRAANRARRAPEHACERRASLFRSCAPWLWSRGAWVTPVSNACGVNALCRPRRLRGYRSPRFARAGCSSRRASAATIRGWHAGWHTFVPR